VGKPLCFAFKQKTVDGRILFHQNSCGYKQKSNSFRGALFRIAKQGAKQQRKSYFPDSLILTQNE
jgi:hypothetical protein